MALNRIGRTLPELRRTVDPIYVRLGVAPDDSAIRSSSSLR